MEGVMVIQGSVLAIITVIAVLSNGLLCALLIRRRQHFSPSTRFLLSLCSCDLAFSLLVFPFVFVSILHGSWEFGDPWCSATAFFWLLATSAGNLTLMAVALDRYFAIVRPLSYSVAGSKFGIVLACIWIVAIPTSALPFFFGIRFEYEILHSMCLVQWEDSVTFTALFLILAFCIPFVVMILCYGRIFRIACSKYESIRQGKTISDRNSVRRPVWARKPSWLGAVLQSPAKGFAVVFVLLGSFLFLWVPYVTVVLSELTGLLPRVPPWQQTVALLASLVSVPSHPFVYGLLNRSVRKNFVIHFGKKSVLRNTASPQRASAVGLLDYIPAMGDWTSPYPLDLVQPNSHVLHLLRKSSDDSGRFSLPSDKDNATVTSLEVDVEMADDRTTPDQNTPIYFIYTK